MSLWAHEWLKKRNEQTLYIIAWSREHHTYAIKLRSVCNLRIIFSQSNIYRPVVNKRG